MSPSLERAMITGASAGLGEQFAVQLAKHGLDLVLVARREERLDALADHLQASGTSVEVLAADLTDAEARQQVAKRLAEQDRPVELLVNNAGFGAYGPVAELPVEGQLAMTELNVSALLHLSQVGARVMRARGRGGILNVASTAGFQPNPYGATYGATKSFVLSFTHALHEELSGSGVRAMALCPGVTRTEFQEVADVDTSRLPSAAVMTADRVVQIALRDFARGRAVSVPGAVNKVLAAATTITPRSISRRFSGVAHRRVFAGDA